MWSLTLLVILWCKVYVPLCTRICYSSCQLLLLRCSASDIEHELERNTSVITYKQCKLADLELGFINFHGESGTCTLTKCTTDN